MSDFQERLKAIKLNLKSSADKSEAKMDRLKKKADRPELDSASGSDDSGSFSGEDEAKGLLLNDSCDMEFESRSTLGSNSTAFSLRSRKNSDRSPSDDREMQVEGSDGKRRNKSNFEIGGKGKSSLSKTQRHIDK